MVMKKLTKVIATIGPSSEDEKIISKLILAGVNVFRLNFKHNTLAWHSGCISKINSVATKLGATIGTLIDLQGPEIRINMPYDQIAVRKNQLLVFGEDVFNKRELGLSISHPQIIPHLKSGQMIVADDGAFRFTIEKSGNGKTYLRSMSEGVLKTRKTLNIPGADFPFPVLVERDFEGLKLAAREAIDYIALSFVRSEEDIAVLRSEMKKYKLNAKVVAKIETQKALDNLEKIIAASDGVMVARGDMGVELPIWEVPYNQKLIIKECIRKGIPVITATQMLESMTEKPFPTRAEVSDVANATYDLTDAVMLSGETAAGRYPVEAVEIMSNTASFNEKQNKVDSRVRFNFETHDLESNICEAAYGLYIKLKGSVKNLGGFVVFTKTGKTARLISRYRPLIPVFAVTPSKEVAESLTANFGIYPICHGENRKGYVDNKQLVASIKLFEEKKLIKTGQFLIVLHGDIWGIEGGSSTIKIITV